MNDSLERGLGRLVRLVRRFRLRLGRSLRKDRSAGAVLGVYGVGFPAALALIGTSAGGGNPAVRAAGGLVGGAIGLAVVVSIARTATPETPQGPTGTGTQEKAHPATRQHPLTDRELGVEILGLAVLVAGCLVCWLLAAVQATLWLPLWIQIPALTLWGLISLHSTLAIATPTARAHLVDRSLRHVKIGPGAALGFTLALAATVTGWYATLTGTLAQHNIVELDPPKPTTDQLVGYYLYQALDFVNLAETLPRWTPIGHRSTGIGLLNVTYRLVILAALVETWRHSRNPNKTSEHRS